MNRKLLDEPFFLSTLFSCTIAWTVAYKRSDYIIILYKGCWDVYVCIQGGIKVPYSKISVQILYFSLVFIIEKLSTWVAVEIREIRKGDVGVSNLYSPPSLRKKVGKVKPGQQSDSKIINKFVFTSVGI